MLYQKNGETELKDDLFRNPSSEYRGAPFWAWNCKVTREDADRIWQDLKEMGMGGAHLHCRTGLDLPYLSPEYMEMVRYSNQKGKQLQMRTWLYDEDRWPSGFAGGKVTQNPAYRQRFLVLSPQPLKAADEEAEAEAAKGGKRKYLGKYAILLKDGCLLESHFLQSQMPEPDGFEIWYLYREIAGDNAWFNNQAYVDTLNPKAIEEFVKITHEAYWRELSDEFGNSVPAVFTDEPQFCFKSTLGFAEEKKKIILPYTDDFPATWQEAYGSHFFDILPECVWELTEGRLSVNRYRYHDHICERFASAFTDTIGKWCRDHGIALTGHMMEEPTLASQTAALGEAMRSYRSFEIPGIDMLYDGRELTTAKQAQSAVHQYGREGMLSELYGVTNWDFDFRGHKLAGDWQAALGVTVRVHHLTWTSMAGEAKRDYPASIGCQSPWYQEYHYIEDYFARLNTALTRGKAEVKVGVIHPIESYWLYWGSREQTQGIRSEMDYHFKKLTEWLLYGLIDFDFIAESLWEELTPDTVRSEEDFLVGEMKYDAILVPNCVTIRKSTLERLKAFQKSGGRVIFTGRVPEYVDAVSSPDAKIFAEECEKIGFSENEILESLEPSRMVDVHDQDGKRVRNMLSQMRKDGNNKWLFLAHCNKMQNPDLPQKEELTIRICGEYQPVLYDAMTGNTRKAAYRQKNGWTIIKEDVYEHDSLLYLLIPHCGTSETVKQKQVPKKQNDTVVLPDFVEMNREEPNVLVLDMAEGKLDDGPWLAREEILRLDNQFRRILGYPLRTEAFAQPWISGEQETSEHTVQLRFRVYADIDVKSPALALESAAETGISVNGALAAAKITGYFTDRAIQTIGLPDLHKGENIIIAEIPYGRRFNVEAMYLLGDFGVRTAGKNAVLTELGKKIAFGDICTQGLPFYGGNLTYRIPVTVLKDCDLKVEATQFRCPLIGVWLDGAACGRIAFSPYSVTIEGVLAGEHVLELTAYGSRVNTFGALHNCNHSEPWPGHPDSFRTSGAAWSYEYQLKQCGILVSPIITCQSVPEF